VQDRGHDVGVGVNTRRAPDAEAVLTRNQVVIAAIAAAATTAAAATAAPTNCNATATAAAAAFAASERWQLQAAALVPRDEPLYNAAAEDEGYAHAEVVDRGAWEEREVSRQQG